MNDFFQPTIYELKTPLAFSIVAHSHLGLLEAQLATIFRPHNAYCIFVDSKAIPSFKSAVGQLVDCYRQGLLKSGYCKCYLIVFHTVLRGFSTVPS